MAYVGRRKIGKFLRPFVRKFNSDNIFLTVIDLFLCRFQVAAGHPRSTGFVFKLHNGRFADGFDSLFGIFFARQLDDNAARAFLLDDRFGQAHFVNTAFNDSNGAVNGIIRNWRARRILCFQDDMRAALQVEPLLYRFGQGPDTCGKDADNDGNGAKKFDHVFETQLCSPSLGM